jgi:hypothetical protein
MGEAHSQLSGAVKNFRYCSHNYPWQPHQRPLHSPKVTAWCAIFEFGECGPYFFEEDDVTVTVTSDRYCAMPENFLRRKLDDLFDEHGFNKMVQQPPHLVVRSVFSEKCFLGMLSPCVAAALASFDPVRVFSPGLPQNRPQTLEGLKDATAQEVAAIQPEMTDPQSWEVPGEAQSVYRQRRPPLE